MKVPTIFSRTSVSVIHSMRLLDEDSDKLSKKRLRKMVCFFILQILISYKRCAKSHKIKLYSRAVTFFMFPPYFVFVFSGRTMDLEPSRA